MSTNSKGNRCILVTGAAGQIGTEFLIELRNRYGNNNVVGIGRKTKPSPMINKLAPGPFIMNINICNKQSINSIFSKYPNIDTIYHLAAILSGTGEQNPVLCWNVNMNGTLNILEIARKRNIKNILIPSSIGAFGPDVPDMKLASQNCGMHPESMYGVTKVSGEILASYYNKKYGMNIRGLRLPGIISIEAMPGGGTTDYAVHIFYDAILKGKYISFIDKDTALPMMYMPDCINSMIDLMEYKGKLKRYTDFNVTAFSFTPNELANVIKKYVKGFEIDYKLDFRQKIAESWPDDMDDREAREQWNWKPKYSLDDMAKDIIFKLRERMEKTGSIYPNVNQSKFSKL
eukprot:97142_1